MRRACARGASASAHGASARVVRAGAPSLCPDPSRMSTRRPCQRAQCKRTRHACARAAPSPRRVAHAHAARVRARAPRPDAPTRRARARSASANARAPSLSSDASHMRAQQAC
eukprot:1949058-Pleurochrysis_carterae.AAC.1